MAVYKVTAVVVMMDAMVALRAGQARGSRDLGRTVDHS